jgi:hypothetical protein
MFFLAIGAYYQWFTLLVNIKKTIKAKAMTTFEHSIIKLVSNDKAT